MTQTGLLDSKSVKIPADIVFERVGDEVVLLELQAGTYFGLDPVGSRIWELLIETGDPKLVVDRFLEEYDVSRDILSRDVERLLAELSEKKLISFE